MGDLENIIYVILIIIYVVSRIFRGAKKTQQPAPEVVRPPVEKKPESLLDTIREEIKRQQELAKAQQEVKQKPPPPQKKVAKASVKKTLQPQILTTEGEPVLDIIEGEGVSALGKKQPTVLKEEKEEAPAFEFDPREAFRMKTLLEKHPLV